MAHLPIVGLALALVGGFQVLAGLVLGALGIVFGANRLVVLIDGAVALAADVVDPTQVYVGPNFGPFGVEIAIDSRAELVRRALKIVLKEVGFGDAIVGQRTGALGFQRFLVFA